MARRAKVPAKVPPQAPATQTLEGEALALAVIAEMCEGKSLRRIARERETSRTSLHRLIEAHIPPDQYARAREAQGDIYAERIDDVRDKVESGELAPDQARVMIDALKWQAAKFHRNRYGEKVELTGDPERPVEVRHRWRFGDKVVEF